MPHYLQLKYGISEAVRGEGRYRRLSIVLPLQGNSTSSNEVVVTYKS